MHRRFFEIRRGKWRPRRPPRPRRRGYGAAEKPATWNQGVLYMCCAMYAVRARCAYATHAQTNRSLALSYRSFRSLPSPSWKIRFAEKNRPPKRTRGSSNYFSKDGQASGREHFCCDVGHRGLGEPEKPLFKGTTAPTCFCGEPTAAASASCGSTAASTASRSLAIQLRQHLHAVEPGSARRHTVLLCPPPHAVLLARRSHNHLRPEAWG